MDEAIGKKRKREEHVKGETTVMKKARCASEMRVRTMKN